jgi:hypothetical protein
MDMSEAILDKRIPQDRRRFSWRTVVFGFTRSRLFFLAVGTMILSCVDAFMTLQLLDRGMYEANPFMAAMIGQGASAFAVTKVSVTGTSILILVFLAKARFLNRLRTGLFLTIFFSIYACLVCYEFVHLLQVL